MRTHLNAALIGLGHYPSLPPVPGDVKENLELQHAFIKEIESIWPGFFGVPKGEAGYIISSGDFGIVSS